MKVEEKLADQRTPVVSTGARELASDERRQSSRKSRRKQNKPGSMTSVVQRLFETCKEIFADAGAGIVPLPMDVDRLRSVLDNVDASDVGLTQNMPYFRRGTLPITYLHLYECDKFSIGIFCLPPSGVIPLHNHPGMTVFSKILFGSMHIKSYDWVNVPQNSNEIVNSLHSVVAVQSPRLRLARVKTDEIFTAPCKTSVLYPEDGGNMHSFTARTSCAVLDVLGPPYSNSEEGRDCTYYNDFPYTSFSGDVSLVPDEDGVYAWLEERKKPDDFFVVGASYGGPRITEQ